MYRNSFWPNGHLAESTSRKEEDIQRRKIAAKALILTSLNGKLVCHFVFQYLSAIRVCFVLYKRS